MVLAVSNFVGGLLPTGHPHVFVLTVIVDFRKEISFN